MRTQLLMVIIFITICPLYTQTFEWAKSFGGKDWDRCSKIVSDNSGNIITIGSFIDTVDFDPNSGVFNMTAVGSDGFIQKLDPSGNLIWAKALVGIAVTDILGIVLDNFGNIYLTGTFQGVTDFDPGPDVFNLEAGIGRSAFVLKLDSNADFLWAKNIGSTFIGIPPSFAQSNAICLDDFGNIYTTGIFTGTVDFDPNGGTFLMTNDDLSFQAYILKLDANGSFKWAKQMGSEHPSFFSSEVGNSILSDSQGNVYLAGTFWGTVDFDPNAGVFNLTSVDSSDIFIQKLDSNGDFIWAKSIGGASDDEVADLALDQFGNIYMVGAFGDMVDFDPNVGTFDMISKGGLDAFILKIDTSGNFIWAKSLGGEYLDGTTQIKVKEDYIFIVGGYQDSVDFDPDLGVFNLVSSGSSDAFILKLDVDGKFAWVETVGGGSFDAAVSIAFDEFNNLYITGVFEEGADFNPEGGGFNLVSKGGWDIWILKLGNEVLCEVPMNGVLFETNVQEFSVSLHLNLPNYQSYQWRYSVMGLNNWILADTTTSPNISLFGLNSCTTYEWQINLQCDNDEWTGWFGGNSFVTKCVSTLAFGDYSKFANEGEILEIPIVLKEFSELSSFQFSINWDTSFFQFIKIQPIQSSLSNFSILNINHSEALTDLGQISTSWFNFPSVLLDPLTELFKIELQVISDICDSTHIEFSSTPTNIEFSNNEIISVNIENANIYSNPKDCLTPVTLVDLSDNVVIYPNPTSNLFYIQTELVITQILIRNLYGSIVNRLVYPPKFEPISILDKGVYFIELNFEDRFIIKKVVVH